MDFSAQYQHQQQGADPSQIQPYDPSTYVAQYQQGAASQSTDPSQIQAYDQSTQAYYAYHQYNQDYNQQYQYSYYPQGYYSNAYQQQQQPYQPEPSSIHPPGVPIPPSSDPYATQQQPQYPYYPQQQQGITYGDVATVTMPNVSHTPAKCLVTRVGIP